MADMADARQAVWAFTEHEHRELDPRDQPHPRRRVRDRRLGHARAVASRPGRPRLVGSIDLEPHIAWEESWLYPEIDVRTGTPWATRMARFDHRQIRDAATRLRADQELLDRDRVRERLVELRCHLFGLEALLRAHIEREERYLIPLLADDASPDPSTDAVGRSAPAG